MQDAQYFPTKTALLGAFLHRIMLFVYVGIFSGAVTVFSDYTFLAFSLPILFGVLYSSIYTLVSTFFSYTFSDNHFVRKSPYFQTSYNVDDLLFIRVDESFPLSIIGAKKYVIAFPGGMEVIYTPTYIDVESWFDIRIDEQDAVITVKESFDDVFIYMFGTLFLIALLSLTTLFILSQQILFLMLTWLIIGVFGVTWILFSDIPRSLFISEHGVLYKSVFLPRRRIFIPRSAIKRVSTTFNTVSFVMNRPKKVLLSSLHLNIYPSSLLEIDLVFDREYTSLIFPTVDVNRRVTEKIRMLLGVK